MSKIWPLAKGERPPALMRGTPNVDEINIGKFNINELLSKRLTGYWNWKRSRHAIHNMPMLDAIINDIKVQNLDHIALTGDLVNIGLPAEFAAAESIIKCIASPQNLSLIPGNHDAYCRNSLPAMIKHFAPYMRGDDVAEVHFPYMRLIPMKNGGNYSSLPLRERVHDNAEEETTKNYKTAIIGVSSAIPTAPFLASGAVGNAQIELTRQMLEAAGNAGFLRVVMIHHPPYKEGAHFGRGLRDAPAFMKMLREAGAELVIHGHNHIQSVELHERRNGASIPIIGVASSSAVPGTSQHKAAYHIYEFNISEAGASLEMITRGSVDGGMNVSEIERRVIYE
jgi:3',5'-cyclic AMP phosphodiesterase CpdA